LIELSKCCKRYRSQLERRVLEKLDLEIWFREKQVKYHQKYWEFKKVLEFLKADIGIKLKFVKEITFD
jgi:hypothetical protein